jgi:hypothetical protein
MILEKQSPISNYDVLIGDNTFKLLQDIHDGNEAREMLTSRTINPNAATLYIARELNFLQDVASASGHEMTSQFLYHLHIELLRKAVVQSPKTKAHSQ